MKLYDENGSFVGDFIAAEKEKISETFDDGLWWLGIVFLIISPFWTIFVIVLWLILKGIIKLIAFILRCVWWIIRLPFYLYLYGELPEFRKDKSNYY